MAMDVDGGGVVDVQAPDCGGEDMRTEVHACEDERGQASDHAGEDRYDGDSDDDSSRPGDGEGEGREDDSLDNADGQDGNGDEDGGCTQENVAEQGDADEASGACGRRGKKGSLEVIQKQVNSAL